MGGDIFIEYYLHENVDIHSRRLIAEFPKYGIKCIEKLQSHCAIMTFADKSRYDSTFQQVTHKRRGIYNQLHKEVSKCT